LTPTATATSAYPHPAFDQLFTSLSSWLPCFGARGDEVRLLNSPSGFYQDVIDMLKRAKRRIFISTLYIGVEETEMVSNLVHKMKDMVLMWIGGYDTESSICQSSS
jgi:CDP-diacylglycerol--glycerol-3-phosphate 3-phosphatidyltransferase